MKVGIPREIKPAEKRVAITPSGAKALVDHGHSVFIETQAGLGSGFGDDAYASAGAKILQGASDVWGEANMIIKVKEPIRPEFEFMRPSQILFTYLHLAANLELTQELLTRKVVSIGYETVQLDDGTLPLLAPMSEVAGKLSVQMGANCLEAKNGGMGILLSHVSGVRPAKVTVIGGGVAGLAAAMVAMAFGAQVSILELNPVRLRYLNDIIGHRIATIMSSPANIEEECILSQLVIGAVLIPGARAPKIIRRDLLKRMRPGSAIVDIAVDQGGCAETTKPTTHEKPTYVEEGIVHYAVTNMPGAVPRTSTIALTNVTLPYALSIADNGWEGAVRRDAALKNGLNLCEGKITCQAIAGCHGLTFNDIEI
jgi:alanine dehydrogenase